MEDDAKRMASPFTKRADPMPHRDAIGAARPLDRPMIDGEDHRLPCFQWHDLDPRLHPWALLGQHEFAAGEIRARFR